MYLARADPTMAKLIKEYRPVDEELDTMIDDLHGSRIFAIVNQ
jgi:DNA-3-methyladenine glycosylase II